MADGGDPHRRLRTTTEGLGGAVRRRRRRLGLNQQELADLAEVSPRFVHDLENGKPTVQLAQVLLVLDALGLRMTLGPGRGELLKVME